MKSITTIAAGCAILIAAPASAQLLGGGGLGGSVGGNLGGSVGGALGGPVGSVSHAGNGALDGDTSLGVDRHSGRAQAHGRTSAGANGAVDGALRSVAGFGRASGGADADAQLIGTDQVRGDVEAVRNRAGDAVANTEARASAAAARTRDRAGNAVGRATGALSATNVSASAGASASGSGSVSHGTRGQSARAGRDHRRAGTVAED